MFDILPGFWTPIVPSRRVKARPLGLELAGERVVLFRGTGGLSALVDRCPHRGVQLSLGRVVDGCLECPFHGWRFRGDGSCAGVPLNPDARTELGRATTLPVREAGGLIWVFTGAVATGEPHVPEALLRPSGTRRFLVQRWRTHWTRAMENMLDAAHLPFVHRRTIGRDMRKRLGADVALQQTVSPTETGFTMRFGMGDDPPGRLDWLTPNGMALHLVDGKKRFVRMHVWCVPETAERTSMLVASVYDFGLLTPLVRLGDFVNRRILTEDRAVVESSSPPEVPPAAAERSVGTDVATLRFRRWYFANVGKRGGDDGLVRLGTGDERRAS